MVACASLPASAQAPQRVTKDPRPRAFQPAPYVAPAIGTTYVYTHFTNTVISVDGWRTVFRDGKGKRAARISHFIPDNPDQPLKIPDEAALKYLWPLAIGAKTSVHTVRGAEQEQWDFVVSDTVTVKVPAGTFLTYRVDGTQNTVMTADPTRIITNLTTYWFAPSVNAVVRVKFVQAKGPRQNGIARNELLRIER